MPPVRTVHRAVRPWKYCGSRGLSCHDVRPPQMSNWQLLGDFGNADRSDCFGCGSLCALFCQNRAAEASRSLLGTLSEPISLARGASHTLSAADRPHAMHMGTGAATLPAAADKGARAGEGLQLPLHQRLPGLHPEHELRRVQCCAAQGRCHRHPGDHPRRGGRVYRALAKAGTLSCPKSSHEAMVSTST